MVASGFLRSRTLIVSDIIPWHFMQNTWIAAFTKYISNACYLNGDNPFDICLALPKYFPCLECTLNK